MPVMTTEIIRRAMTHCKPTLPQTYQYKVPGNPDVLVSVGRSTLPALVLHIIAFSDISENGDIIFSPATISAAVARAGEPHPDLVGFAVSIFNAKAAVGAICPLGRINFAPLEERDFSQKLHRGTFRLWGPEGHVDESALNRLMSDQQDDHGLLKLTPFLDRLSAFTDMAPDEVATSRHATFLSGEVVEKVELFAIKQAYAEVFKLLACDHAPDGEPMVHAELFRCFIYDGGLALAVADHLRLGFHLDPGAASSNRALDSSREPQRSSLREHGMFASSSPSTATQETLITEAVTPIV